MGKWKNCTIADVGTVVGGATPSTKHAENYVGGTIAWITPKDLSDFHGRFISKGERNITKAGLEGCSAQLLPANTVLFSSRAPIGYIAIAENEVCTNQGFKSVVPNSSTDPLFLFYLLKYNKGAIESMGSGTTFKEVSGSTMKQIPIRIPEQIDEQKKIGQLLGCLDDKIEENEQINQNLEQQMQLIYREFSSDLQGGVLPLSKIIDVRDGTHDSPKTTATGYPLITSKHLLPFGVDLSSANFISQTDYDKINERSKVDTGDILISMIGTVGIISYIINPVNFAIKNVGLFKTSQSPLYAVYILEYLKSKETQTYIEKHLAGSTQKYISLGELRKLPVLLPQENKLKEFNNLVIPILNRISLAAKENCYLIDLRDALLPRLMSGDLDVSNLDM